MKKIIIAFVFVSATTAFAQNSDSTAKVYKNEFSLDVTGTIRQFLYINGSQFPEYYTPTYYLAYRRFTPKGNFRSGIGGILEYRQLAPFAPGDDREYFSRTTALDVRVGWEFQNNIGKRWQFFYGLDYRQTLYYYKNDAPYSNGGYYNGVETTTYSFGAAPVAGFRFRINERVSLYTESSFTVLFEKSDTRRYYIPYSSQYPPLPDNNTPTLRSFYGRFSQPLSVFLAFNI